MQFLVNFSFQKIEEFNQIWVVFLLPCKSSNSLKINKNFYLEIEKSRRKIELPLVYMKINFDRVRIRPNKIHHVVRITKNNGELQRQCK